MNEPTSGPAPSGQGAATAPASAPPSAEPGRRPNREPSPELIAELIAFRRDLHRNPELGRGEFRTTGLLMDRLRRAGLDPRPLPGGTGLLCDLVPEGAPEDAPRTAFRADIDALPIEDAKPEEVPYRSQVAGRCHACGHDVHTTIVLGTGLMLAEALRAGRLRRPVRLVLQPAEEVMPGGALDVIKSGGLENVGRIYAVHCDPKVDVGRIGLRAGAITSACDKLNLTLSGPGGHTARPHLTTDLVDAVARMATDLPSALSRRLDPRWGVSLVWGRITAGSAANVIPQRAELEGTVRCLELDGWREAPEALQELIGQLAEAYRAKWEISHLRGVPPVVNEAESVRRLGAAMDACFGAGRVEDTAQSLGGEDFSWYLERVPGALARLGVRDPESGVSLDLHQGTFDVDERAIGVGVRLFTELALAAEPEV
ncbi:amidohydrolase [Phaeacidiphilus oryzae]|uniref:amidohydrolase n=1 Tax=Phaeacidiphilus oryzae TaxID=348818 RepID=UPI00068E0DC3